VNVANRHRIAKLGKLDVGYELPGASGAPAVTLVHGLVASLESWDGAGVVPVIDAMRSLNADPLTDRLRELRVPTLIIVGDQDFLGVGGSVILSRAIAGSEFEIVSGRGHGVHHESVAVGADGVTKTPCAKCCKPHKRRTLPGVSSTQMVVTGNPALESLHHCPGRA